MDFISASSPEDVDITGSPQLTFVAEEKPYT